MKLILAEESSRDAKVKEKLDFLNSQYESKDEIPKSVVHIKIDESISQERYDEIMFGVGQQIRDQALTTYDKRSSLVWFDDIQAKMQLYVIMLSLMIMTLTFFMLVMAFTQKARDLTWEHSVLRSIGITKEQGFRIFAYEAICIVSTAVITGVAIGMVCTFFISNLQTTLMEMPLNLHFPVLNCSILIMLIIVSTYFSLRGPVGQMNRKSIASGIKCGI